MPNLNIQYHLILLTVAKDVRRRRTPQFDIILTINPPMRETSADELATYSSVLSMHDSRPGLLPVLSWKSWKDAGYERDSDVIATMILGTVGPERYQELVRRLCDAQTIVQWMDPALPDASAWTMPAVISAALESLPTGLLQTGVPLNFGAVVGRMDMVSSAVILDSALTASIYKIFPPEFEPRAA
ncbi:hypothetical protein B0H21DRAFT_741144 [Amylocystis lapponica]|nr:hypothetical protein B0H21DRAFT_741144 [Amylocystis lapponica]